MSWLFRPVLIYPLVYFRIAFGLLMFAEGVGAVLTGWVHEYYLEPKWHFPYIGLGWIKVLPGDGMLYIFWAQAAVALAIMVGWRYRLMTVLYFLLNGYAFWCEKTHYLNHHYLIWLVSGLLIFLPLHRWASLDARRNPQLRSEVAPAWPLYLLRFQVFLVYCYAGIAKLQPDWLAGRPIGIWFGYKADYPFIGPYLATEWMVRFVSVGGFLFDLLIGFFLLWPRTRTVAFWATVTFHLFNSAVFQVGVFPYFMIAATVLFFRPGQIGRWFFGRWTNARVTLPELPLPGERHRTVTAALLGACVAFQLLFPLRHFLIPGDVNWTEEGHRYSWRMMLRSKTGTISYTIKDLRTGQIFTEYPSQYLTPGQDHDLAGHPDMIWQFAQHLKKLYQEKGHPEVAVYTHSSLSLNGYDSKPLVDPTVNLAAISYKWGRKSWVTDRVETKGWLSD